MRALHLAQYARETGGTTDADVESHIHAGLRSVRQTKTYRAFFERKLAKLQAARDATREAYRAALAAGELAEPAKATLEEIAMGEGSAAEAARRLIAKRAGEHKSPARADHNEGESK